MQQDLEPSPFDLEPSPFALEPSPFALVNCPADDGFNMLRGARSNGGPNSYVEMGPVGVMSASPAGSRAGSADSQPTATPRDERDRRSHDQLMADQQV